MDAIYSSLFSELSLVVYCEDAIGRGEIDNVLDSLKLLFEFAYPRLDEMSGKVLKSKLPLTPDHRLHFHLFSYYYIVISNIFFHCLHLLCLNTFH